MVQLHVDSFGLTDKGRVRTTNQDSFLIAEVRRAMHVLHSSLDQPSTLIGEQCALLFIVADGMGGHRGGEQASALAVVTIEQFLLNSLGWLFRLQGEGVLAEFQAALRTADQRIIDAAARRPDLEGMGTTLTMAYAVGEMLYIAHVGDSRCYLLRKGELEQLTTDHKLVDKWVKDGVLSDEEAAHHPMRNIIINSVGGPSAGIRTEIHKHALAAENMLLVCSDGLTDMVADDEIAAVLKSHSQPEAACRQLIDAANVRGGHDNVTAIVARFSA